MRNVIVFAALLLAACGAPLEKYEPALSQAPLDRGKYQTDLATCKVQAEQRMQAALDDPSNKAGAFGLAGYAVGSATADDGDDYYKTTPQMTDECMIANGYKVIPNAPH